MNKTKSLFSTRGNCNCWLIQETKIKRRVRHTEIVTIYLVCLDGLNEQSFPPQGASGFSFDHSAEVVTSMGRGGGGGGRGSDTEFLHHFEQPKDIFMPRETLK